MKLQTKLLVALLPPVLLTIALLGVWAAYNATQAQFTTWRLQMDGVLRSYVGQNLRPHYELLRENGLDAVPSFVTQYQREAAALVDRVPLPWEGHVFILSGEGSLVHSPEGYLPKGAGQDWDSIVRRMQLLDLEVMNGEIDSKAGSDFFCAIRFEPWDWYVFAALDSEVITRTRGRLLHGTILAVGLGGLVVVVLVMLLFRIFFLGPLTQLRHATAEIAANREPTGGGPETSDELGELGKDILRMGQTISKGRKRLKRWNEQLEEQVRMRTAEMTAANDRLGESLRRREEAQKVLRMYERIISNTSDLVSLVDGEAVYRMVNDAYVQAFQMPRSEILGRSIGELIGMEQYELHSRPNIERALAGESFRYESWITLPVLGRRFMSISYTPIPEPSGRIGGVSLTARDITDLKRAEQNLQRYADRLVLATNVGGIGVWEWRLENDELIWDEHMFKIFGIERQDMGFSFETWSEMVHPDDLAPMVERVQGCIASGEDFEGRFRILRPDGEIRHVQAVGHLYVDETGQATSMVGINQDITEAMRMQELREDIERITRHDLKSPIISAIGVTQLMMEEPNINESQREMLALVEKVGRKMLETINISLDLFKMETGVYELNAVPLDVPAIMREAMETNLAIAGYEETPVRLLAPEGCGSDCQVGVLGEARLLSATMDNLIKNAVEASPPGEEVTITLRCEDGCRITIGNKGEVPMEIREQFFEKYVTSGKKHGTGLGTYSARLLTRAQNGTIHMRTGAGKTEVTIVLPAVR